MNANIPVEQVMLVTLLIVFLIVGMLILLRLGVKRIGKSLNSETKYYYFPPYLSWICVAFWSVLVASWGYKELVRIFSFGIYEQSTIAIISAVVLSIALCGVASGMKSWVMAVGGAAGGVVTFCVTYIYTVQTINIIV